MKKRKLFLVLGAVVVLIVSCTIIAFATDAKTVDNIKWFFGINTANLTDQQKADANDYLNKMTDLQKENAKEMADLQKEAINKMVQNGSMTKEQGDAAIKKIDDQLTKIQQGELPKGAGLGLGMEKGPFGAKGKDDVDLSKLTDAQKADLKGYITQIANLQKEAVNKLVADGVMTQEQADAAIKKIDVMANSDRTNVFPGGKMGKGEFRRNGFMGNPKGNQGKNL